MIHEIATKQSLLLETTRALKRLRFGSAGNRWNATSRILRRRSAPLFAHPPTQQVTTPTNATNNNPIAYVRSAVGCRCLLSADSCGLCRLAGAFGRVGNFHLDICLQSENSLVTHKALCKQAWQAISRCCHIKGRLFCRKQFWKCSENVNVHTHSQLLTTVVSRFAVWTSLEDYFDASNVATVSAKATVSTDIHVSSVTENNLDKLCQQRCDLCLPFFQRETRYGAIH